MVKEIKKGTLGQQSKYMTRAKAIRKLQLSLQDFRRICILKGVYPRQPPSQLKKSGKVYYHKKDIAFLATDPLNQTFSRAKIIQRKYKHFIARKQELEAQSVLKNMPKPDFSHLVKERYPTFIDALRDLQDPLCLVNLYASFQSHKGLNISNEQILASMQISKQFSLYVIAAHALKKVFLSIKGIYYQVQIQGVTINWLVPYKYPPILPFQVDYKVFSTFLQFYHVLLKFVLFRLYSSLSLVYPPALDFSLQKKLGSSLRQYLLKPIQNAQTKIADEKYKIDDQFIIGKERQLFEGLVFYVSNQCPKESLEFIILAKGGQIFTKPDPIPNNCTHLVTQKLDVIVKTCQNVQPQWLYDCINKNKLISVRGYEPGALLPPHKSPWDPTQEQEDNDEQKLQKLEMVKSLLTKKKRSELKRLQAQKKKGAKRRAQVSRKRAELSQGQC